MDDFATDATTARVESHLQLGQHLLSAHAGEKAIEQFRAALSLDPDHAETHAWLALALSDAKRFDAALHEIDLGLAGEPNNSFYVFVKGVVYAGCDRWKEAQKYFEEAVALAPSVAKYHAHLAQSFYHQEKKAEAEAAARAALELDPEEETALLYLGFCLLDARRMAEAGVHFERALQLDPDNSDAHNAIGLHFLQNKQHDKALHHIREALRIDPQSNAAQHNLILAMGAKSWFYGLFWKWSLFLNRFSSQGQIAVILGAWVLMQVLRAVGRSNPSLQPMVALVGVVYFVFCIYTWTAPFLFKWWLKRSQPF